MVWEIAQIDIKPGQEADFEAAVAKAAPLFQSAKGCRGMQIQRSIEFPSRYRLIVDWETLEDHTVHFRGSDNFQQWRALAGPFFESPPVVEHTEQALKAF